MKRIKRRRPKWPSARPTGDTPVVALEVHTANYGAVVLAVEAAGDTVKLPLSPAEARLLAGLLLARANAFEPMGRDLTTLMAEAVCAAPRLHVTADALCKLTEAEG